MTRVVISKRDGGVAIMHLVLPEASDELINAEVARLGFAVAAWRRLDPAETLPADRAFREAWTDGQESVTVDMGKARTIHRDRLRALRAPLLSALDAEYMRADEAGDDAAKKRIAARKQTLRDVTADPVIDAATTPDELSAVIPAVLTGG